MITLLNSFGNTSQAFHNTFLSVSLLISWKRPKPLLAFRIASGLTISHSFKFTCISLPLGHCLPHWSEDPGFSSAASPGRLAERYIQQMTYFHFTFFFGYPEQWKDHYEPTFFLAAFYYNSEPTRFIAFRLAHLFFLVISSSPCTFPSALSTILPIRPWQ